MAQFAPYITLSLMKNLTANKLRTADEAEVFDFLTNVLEERMPLGPRHPEFLSAVQRLPAGLRAMVTTHHLDVSLTKDDLGWHFGNWHHYALAQETANGLDVLEAHELAKIFRQALELARAYWDQLGEPDWSIWYDGSQLEKLLNPLNAQAYEICEKSWNGILGYWVVYARKNPLEFGATDDA